MNIDFKRIPQNARTIIFERFNDQKDNLCSSLNGCDDADLIDAGNKLLVKSFEEFKKILTQLCMKCIRRMKMESFR